MKVHHLNCGTMRMPTVPALVSHVLLLETDAGLVLVDTGFGLEDIADPARRLGWFRHVIRPVFSAEETAARQVERLGFTRDDVRHIIITHFDMDHIGGLADFPHAAVHATAAEARGATRPASWLERQRYRSPQLAHGPKIVEHSPDGEMWRGFAAARELTGIAPGLVLLSLPGHTRGHAAAAVDTGHRWILHAGDAFYHDGTLHGRARVPAALRTMEANVAADFKKIRQNHARLAELYRRAEPDLSIICSHDRSLFAEDSGSFPVSTADAVRPFPVARWPSHARERHGGTPCASFSSRRRPDHANEYVIGADLNGDSHSPQRTEASRGPQLRAPGDSPRRWIAA